MSILDCKCTCHENDPALPAHLSAGCPTAEGLLIAAKQARRMAFLDAAASLRASADVPSNQIAYPIAVTLYQAATHLEEMAGRP